MSNEKIDRLNNIPSEDLGRPEVIRINNFRYSPWLRFKSCQRKMCERGEVSLPAENVLKKRNRATPGVFSSRYQWEERANASRWNQMSKALAALGWRQQQVISAFNSGNSELPGDFGEGWTVSATTFRLLPEWIVPSDIETLSCSVSFRCESSLGRLAKVTYESRENAWLPSFMEAQEALSSLGPQAGFSKKWMSWIPELKACGWNLFKTDYPQVDFELTQDQCPTLLLMRRFPIWKLLFCSSGKGIFALWAFFSSLW